MGCALERRPAMRLVLAGSMFCVIPAMRQAFGARWLKGRTVAFISSASYPEGYGWVNRAMRWPLEHALGVQVRLVRAGHARPSWVAQQLSEADVIYVCGGNTFYLMDELRRSGAACLIETLVRAGKPYAGESAGAVIAGAHIGHIGAMDRASAAPGLADLSGLGFIDRRVVPHVGSATLGASATRVMQRARGGPAPLPLRNDQAAIVEGGALRVRSYPNPLGWV